MSVYFATCREANAVKIGSSVDPWGRLAEIQTGCPLDVTIEAIVPGNHEEEFAYHRRFADDRIRGEWFHLTEMIEAIIAASPAGERPRKLIRTVTPIKDEKKRIREGRLTEGDRIEARRLRGYLQRRVNSGDIIFPFRTKEPA